MRSSRDKAVDKMSELLDMISAERLLDFLITNHLSGTDAFNAMESAEEEFFPSEDEDYEDDNYDEYDDDEDRFGEMI